MSSNLKDELAATLNRFSAENQSNTPDFILANYLLRCLSAFEQGVLDREQWYGIKSEPGGSSVAVAVPSPAALASRVNGEASDGTP